MAFDTGMMTNVQSNVDGPERQPLEDLMDQVHAAVAAEAARRGMTRRQVPLLGSVSFVVAEDASRVQVAFAFHAPGAAGSVLWWRDITQKLGDGAAAQAMIDTFGMQPAFGAGFPKPGDPRLPVAIDTFVAGLFAAVDRELALGTLGDISHVDHLEEPLRAFLEDHPDYDCNVFVMMRFSKSDQLTESFETIQAALASVGMNGVRADSREYTDELWSNIVVHMTGCKYGIAVFEDFEQTRDFNPNVSLELGYMLGRNKRVLLLKEQRLPNLPADVVHRLYKPFDQFDIAASVTREVTRWVRVDLGLS